jgi:hypothetical protein
MYLMTELSVGRWIYRLLHRGTSDSNLGRRENHECILDVRWGMRIEQAQQRPDDRGRKGRGDPNSNHTRVLEREWKDIQIAEVGIAGNERSAVLDGISQ